MASHLATQLDEGTIVFEVSEPFVGNLLTISQHAKKTEALNWALFGPIDRGVTFFKWTQAFDNAAQTNQTIGPVNEFLSQSNIESIIVRAFVYAVMASAGGMNAYVQHNELQAEQQLQDASLSTTKHLIAGFKTQQVVPENKSQQRSSMLVAVKLMNGILKEIIEEGTANESLRDVIESIEFIWEDDEGQEAQTSEINQLKLVTKFKKSFYQKKKPEEAPQEKSFAYYAIAAFNRVVQFFKPVWEYGLRPVWNALVVSAAWYWAIGMIVGLTTGVTMLQPSLLNKTTWDLMLGLPALPVAVIAGANAIDAVKNRKRRRKLKTAICPKNLSETDADKNKLIELAEDYLKLSLEKTTQWMEEYNEYSDIQNRKEESLNQCAKLCEKLEADLAQIEGAILALNKDKTRRLGLQKEELLAMQLRIKQLLTHQVEEEKSRYEFHMLDPNIQAANTFLSSVIYYFCLCQYPANYLHDVDRVGKIGMEKGIDAAINAMTIFPVAGHVIGGILLAISIGLSLGEMIYRRTVAKRIQSYMKTNNINMPTVSLQTIEDEEKEKQKRFDKTRDEIHVLLETLPEGQRILLPSYLAKPPPATRQSIRERCVRWWQKAKQNPYVEAVSAQMVITYAWRCVYGAAVFLFFSSLALNPWALPVFLALTTLYMLMKYFEQVELKKEARRLELIQKQPINDQRLEESQLIKHQLELAAMNNYLGKNLNQGILKGTVPSVKKESTSHLSLAWVQSKESAKHSPNPKGKKYELFELFRTKVSTSSLRRSDSDSSQSTSSPILESPLPPISPPGNDLREPLLGFN